MSGRKPTLAFVSPVFLFPNDAGGKIRTTNILRGLKGGAFNVSLLSPATGEQAACWASEIEKVADRFVPWMARRQRPRWARAVDLLRRIPFNVAADRNRDGARAVRELLQGGVDVIVFDFVHSAVLRPAELGCADVCFTHNVESEIFKRQAEQARSPLSRWIWSSQWKKMDQFERAELRRFGAVIAVSDRDALFFRTDYGIDAAFSIPTGVDLDFFAYAEPPATTSETPPTVVFTGSMNWIPNIDGIRFFLDKVWGEVTQRVPNARLLIVGRDPPEVLVRQGRVAGNVEFTGFVDDVRPFVRRSHAFVIPLLVGGGTRIKAFEAMAMGCPIVSTSIGIEGLDIEAGRHFLRGDTAVEFADAIVGMLQDAALRRRISKQARVVVEEKFSYLEASRCFERVCLETLERWRRRHVQRAT